MIDKLTGKEAMGMVKSVEGVFKNVPHLPKGVVDFLVSVAPWLTGLGGVLSIYGGVTSLFLTGRRNELMMYIDRYAGVNSAYFAVLGLFALVVGVLYLMAFKPLKAMKMTGWMYLFWGNVLGIVQGIASLLFGFGGIVGTVIGAAIGFYFLFEVKPRYK